MSQYSQKPPLGRPLNLGHPLARDLIGCWLFQEGTGSRVADLSGYSNPGTIVNATWSPGPWGSRLKFDGAGDYVDIGTNTVFARDTYTWIAWAATSNTPGSDLIIVDRRTPGDATQGTGFLYIEGGSGKPKCGLYTTTNNARLVVGTASMVDGIPHMIASTCDGVTLKLYVDGRYINQTAISGTVDTTGSQKLWIGEGPYNSSQCWLGTIECALIYKRVLQPSEIASLYADPFAMFRRPRIELWTPSGVVTTTSSTTSTTTTTTTAPARIVDEVDAWQVVTAGALAVGNPADVSGSYGTELLVELAPVGATDGAEVIIEISYGDDNWTTLTTVKGTAETPATTTINDAAVNAADTSLTLTDATTGDFDINGRKWFIEDGTIGNSESVRTLSQAANVVTLCQGLQRAHADGLNVYDRVDEWRVPIPWEVAYVHVLLNNVDADVDCAFTTRVSKRMTRIL